MKTRNLLQREWLFWIVSDVSIGTAVLMPLLLPDRWSSWWWLFCVPPFAVVSIASWRRRAAPTRTACRAGSDDTHVDFCFYHAWVVPMHLAFLSPLTAIILGARQDAVWWGVATVNLALPLIALLAPRVVRTRIGLAGERLVCERAWGPWGGWRVVYDIDLRGARVSVTEDVRVIRITPAARAGDHARRAFEVCLQADDLTDPVALLQALGIKPSRLRIADQSRTGR